MVNKQFYIPENIPIKPYIYDDDDYDNEDLFEIKADELFHIGQTYEDKVVDTIYCKHCGGNEFNVGVGSYYTAIKCKVCGWETCIHDG